MTSFSSFVRTYSVEKEEEEEEEEGGEVGSGKSTEVGGPWHKVEEDSVIGVRSHACLRRLQVSPGEDSTDLLLRLRLLLLLLSRCARSRASHSFPWPSRRLLFPLPGDRSLCSSLTDPIRRSPSLSRLAGDGSAHLSLTDRPVALVCSCYSGSQEYNLQPYPVFPPQLWKSLVASCFIGTLERRSQNFFHGLQSQVEN